MAFRDRAEAGRQLGELLVEMDLSEPLVLALPRGGLPVAMEVAALLNADLEVFVARKVGAPGHPEFGIGAVAEGDCAVVDRRTVDQVGISPRVLDELIASERVEMERRVSLYRKGRSLPAMHGRDVILVDDGLATGVTAEAALRSLRSQVPRTLLLAAPACAPPTADRLQYVADGVVCVTAPEEFFAVGQFYEAFDQLTDEEVLDMLRRARRPGSKAGRHEIAMRAVAIDVGGEEVRADLALPPQPIGTVVFAHGSGSGRHSSRNRMVAAQLQERGLATLLLDLLTEEEERADARTGHLRFDIDFLATRLQVAMDWVRAESATASLPVCLFGASTGAAAALVAAARQSEGVAAIVSRGGRPDLAGQTLGRVRASTLLIVGGRDDVVIELNKKAMARMHAERRLEIVPGATHLFPEAGALEEVSRLAGEWFVDHLGRQASAMGGRG